MYDVKECLKDAEKFVRHFNKFYIENRNVDVIADMLHKDITWIDVGFSGMYQGSAAVVDCIKEEIKILGTDIIISDQNYNVSMPTENTFIVVVQLFVKEKNLGDIFKEFELKQTAICTRGEDAFKMLHVHNSMPSYINFKTEATKEYNTLLNAGVAEYKKQLIDKTTQYNNLVSNIHGAIQICERKEGFPIIYISEGFLKLTGYFKDDIINELDNKHINLIHITDRDKVAEEVSKQVREKKEFSVEYRIIKRDGTTVWVLDKGFLFKSADGKECVQSIIMDISHQKKQEEELRISKKRYEIALEQLDVTMFEYDILTKELLFLDRTAKSYGFSTVLPNGPQTMVDKGFIQESSAKDYLDMYVKIHAGMPSASTYISTQDINGECRDYELCLTTVYDDLGAPIRAIGVRKDVSNILQLKKEKKFGQTMFSDKIYVGEIDITDNVITDLSDVWAKKLNAQSGDRYDKAIKKGCELVVAEDYWDYYLKKMSQENILSEYNKGKTKITFDYKRKVDHPKETEMLWFEATVNIIKDERTGNVMIRYYTTDITNKKKEEKKNFEEKILYDRIVSKSKLAYEANISKNVLIRGHELWDKLFSIEFSNDLDEMMLRLAKNALHKDDAKRFARTFNHKNLISKFNKGIYQEIIEYRRKNYNNKMIWMRCTLHMFTDPETGDIKGYAYAEDIDKQKKKELELEYSAKHDNLTGFYNKYTTEKLIDEYLAEEGKDKKHAFLMIDIDYFKNLNDTLGHVFGDKVLKDVTAKIASLFRKEDIIGRIGGDEFCALLKNITCEDYAKAKAKELCKKIYCTYKDEENTNATACIISISIGIAIYNKHGHTYEELYKYADSALYVSKKSGKNQYYI